MTSAVKIHKNRFSCLIEEERQKKYIKQQTQQQKPKKRRRHINFKIQIKSKLDIDTYIKFLHKDIRKRKIIDRKYQNDNNECHLKHLNFITMEVLLLKTLELYSKNYTEVIEENNENNISGNILYTPSEEYKKDLTSIQGEDISTKYNFLHDEEELNRIAIEIFTKYKSFGFINLNFLKRKIYEYI